MKEKDLYSAARFKVHTGKNRQGVALSDFSWDEQALGRCEGSPCCGFPQQIATSDRRNRERDALSVLASVNLEPGGAVEILLLHCALLSYQTTRMASQTKAIS